MLAGLSGVPQELSATDATAGWRRSAHRTGLRPNSLQTGNFTAIFAKISLSQTSVAQETPEPQRLLSRFPIGFIREIVGEDRGFSALIRENRLRFRRPLVLRKRTPWNNWPCARHGRPVNYYPPMCFGRLRPSDCGRGSQNFRAKCTGPRGDHILDRAAGRRHPPSWSSPSTAA